MIIGIAGKAGSGKDTFANALIKKYSVKRDTLAAPIKRFVQDVFRVEWDIVDGLTKEGREQREKELSNWPGWTVRKLLQFIGTELMRNNIEKDIWVRSVILRMNEKPKTNWIVTDVRFPNEMDGLRNAYGKDFVMVKVVRNSVKELNGIKNHESEAYDLPADVVIDNNGTLEELMEKVDLFAASVNLKKSKLWWLKSIFRK